MEQAEGEGPQQGARVGLDGDGGWGWDDSDNSDDGGSSARSRRSAPAYGGRLASSSSTDPGCSALGRRASFQQRSSFGSGSSTSAVVDSPNPSRTCPTPAESHARPSDPAPPASFNKQVPRQSPLDSFPSSSLSCLANPHPSPLRLYPHPHSPPLQPPQDPNRLGPLPPPPLPALPRSHRRRPRSRSSGRPFPRGVYRVHEL